MTEVNTGGLIHLRETDGRLRSILQLKRELAHQHGIQPIRVGHCIDGAEHAEFGRNKRFKVVQAASKAGQPALAIERHDGSMELLSHRYLGTSQRTGLFEQRNPVGIHFYEKLTTRR